MLYTTEKKRAEIRKRAEAASKGPWAVGMRNGSNGCYVFDRSGKDEDGYHDNSICRVYGVDLNRRVKEVADNAGTPNAVFIANARDDVPHLLDDCDLLDLINEELAEQNNKLRDALKRAEKALNEASGLAAMPAAKFFDTELAAIHEALNPKKKKEESK